MVRIAHIADIHIRALSRHDEYRDTFRKFIDDCKSQNVTHIFVGGDIFHTKTTGISPEYIDLLTWWLTEMVKVAPVHMILGNHDGNLVNLSRQDAVSPIVDALAHPNVFLYKKSGVYNFAPGYNFCVFSLFDEEGYDSVKPVPGDINIACYHGAVWGSKTESDWAIEDGIAVPFFKDYDFTLLGDIHKRQFLAYRDYKPTMAYPGTLIQQNYAEDLDHGYLIWDIHSKDEWDVEYHSIPNLKPFVTLEWTGSVESTFEIATDYPVGTRFRIKSLSHISQFDIHQLTNLLKKELKATEVTFKIDQQINREVIKAESQVMQRHDLREPEILTSLIKNYHSSIVYSDDTWQKINDQIKSYLQQVSSSDECARNAKWSLKNLKFDNLFSYGEENEINFDNLNGVVGIFGSNRAGKSSIVGSIMYSLFNTTDRGPMKNLHICNIRKDYCYSKASISVNGIDYIIERQTSKNENKKGIISAATALNLFKVDASGALEDMAGEQRTSTDKTLRKLIGNSDDFLMTSLSAQGEINQFIQNGSSKRRHILSKFLDLDIFDKMFELSNKEVNTLKAQLKLFPEKDWKSIENSFNNELILINNNLNQNTEKIKDLNFSLSEAKNKLSKHSNFSLVTVDQVSSQKNKVNELNALLNKERKLLETTKSDISSLTDKINTINSVNEDNDVDSLKKRFDLFRSLDSSVKELKQIHEKEATILKQQEKSIKILDEVPCGDKFPTCKFIKDAYSTKEKIEIQQNKTNVALQKLDKAILSLDELKSENIEDKLIKLQKLKDMHAKLSLQISSKTTDIVKIENNISQLEKNLNDSTKKLAELEEALKNDENAEVTSLRLEINDLNKKISALDNEKISFAGKIGKINSDLEKLNNENTQRQKLLQKMNVFELISSAFSRKGVPSSIVTSQMPLINAEIANILSGIVDFTIELEIDDESDSMEVYINYGDSRRIIELASGMEKMISSIAIRVALINISSLPKTDMFIIDEGFGALDESGVEACNRLLVSLKKYFKTIFVITHVDGIKDVADTILEISKNEKDSKINYE
jgi:DNA repair exonuclease SbcCD ATPase subunit/DNA repair exonuclease SbcCD nuclease subunit